MLDGKGKAGAILNIIGASIWIFVLFILFFPLVVFPIVTIVTNSNFLKGKNNQVSAGVWGILFGGVLGVIGGILVLVSNGNKPKNEPEDLNLVIYEQNESEEEES